MSIYDVLFKDQEKFTDKSGNVLHFIDYKDNIIRCHKIHSNHGGCIESSIEKINVVFVPMEELQRLAIWEGLDKKVQDEVLSIANETEHELKLRLASARNMRKKKREDLPEFLTCACGVSIKANFNYLQKKSDETGLTIEDLIKNYQCQKCHPTKGRRKKEGNESSDSSESSESSESSTSRVKKFANLPEFLTCACGAKTKANYYYLEKKAEQKQVTIQDLIDQYECQTCHPTKGRQKK